MDPFEPAIGLEVHAQLRTESKIFCACSARFGDPPNTRVCPVCLGLPGALPVLNARAVDAAVRAALALHCTIRTRSVFARKNYFYPDLPKGYQISQYTEPLAEGGWLEVEPGGRRVGIARVHLEEDAGKSLHHGFPDSDRRSYLDFNRSGVPLVEIVTEPALASAAEAAGFFSRLRAVLVEIGVTDGNMEEGSLRCDANVSVRRPGSAALGVKTEVKNLNSFRYLQRALEFEIARQIDALGAARPVAAGDAAVGPGGRTHRGHAHEGSGARLSLLSGAGPRRPRHRRGGDRRGAGVAAGAARRAARAPRARLRPRRLRRRRREPGRTRHGASTSRRPCAAGAPPKAAANWVLGEVRRALHELGAEDIAAVAGPVPPARLAALIALVESGRVSGPVAKDVFARMRATGRQPAEIVEADQLGRVDDEAAIAAAIREVMAAHPRAVAEYRARQDEGVRVPRGAGDEGDRGPRRPGPPHPAAARDARRGGRVSAPARAAARVAVLCLRAIRPPPSTKAPRESRRDRSVSPLQSLQSRRVRAARPLALD